MALLSVPSHDQEPLPPSSGADYYVNRPEERMKRWAEEDKGGQTKPGLHKHRKYHCCVGSASSLLQRLSTAHSFLFIKGPREFWSPSVQGVFLKKKKTITGHVQTERIIDLIIICPQDISLSSCSLWVYLRNKKTANPFKQRGCKPPCEASESIRRLCDQQLISRQLLGTRATQTTGAETNSNEGVRNM